MPERKHTPNEKENAFRQQSNELEK